MKKIKSIFIYRPKFNSKAIFKRSLIFLILDIIIMNLLYRYSNLEYVLNYVYIRFILTVVSYILRMLKYSAVLVKHRLDIFVVTNNKDLQDDLYYENDLIKDIMSNNFKELILAIELFTLSMLFSYTISIYSNIFKNFNFTSILITDVLFTSLVAFISYRIEAKFKISEDRHNILMFLISGDKI